jgi:menaquinone-specific isochorismate synthase
VTADLLVSADPRQGAVPRLCWAAEVLPDVPDLLAALPPDIDDLGLLAWVGGPAREDSPALVGWGNAAEAVFGGPEPLTAAAQWWAGVIDAAVAAGTASLELAGPIAFVSAAFAPDSARGTVVRVPAVVLRRIAGATVLVRCARVGDHLPEVPVLGQAALPAAAGAPVVSDGELDGTAWSAAVSAVVERLRDGAARKVVLARQLRARLPADLDLRRPLRLLDRDYPSCWTYAMDGLFGATPELLARRSGTTVTSRVLAGTIRREGDGTVSADALAHSAKDRDEHRIAAQSVAHILRRRCSDVGLVGPRLLELPNVLHLATDLTATLTPRDRGVGALLSLAGDLHPTAAVGGTPRAAALELIAAAEGFDRGRYGAPVGWIDASGDGELGLALRCGQLDPDDRRCVTLYAGAGIVEGSDPAAELAETDAKFLPVLGALSG